MTGRTIVVGDVHGCLDELKELLLEVVQIEANDRVVFLGDLVDRGPDPAGVVDFAHSIGASAVMGNHEEKALRWRRHEVERVKDPGRYKNPMRDIDQSRLDQWAKIPDAHWDWIASWPTFLHLNEKWTAVHAGCMPDIEIEQQVPNELMRLRYVRRIESEHGYHKYRMATLKPSGEPNDPKPGESITHWTELWGGPRNIVYGHFVWDKMHKTVNPITGAETFGIDTGCVHGGHLTAFVLCSDHLYTAKVDAKKTYVPIKPWNEE